MDSRIKLAVDVVLMQYSVGNDWEGHEGMHFQFWNWKTGHDWLVRPSLFSDALFLFE